MSPSASDPWSRLSRRVVVVSSFAARDGIGRYADQLIAADSDGRSFVRVGIPEGPGDYGRELHRGPRALWLLRDARRGDDVVVHYHPHYFIRGGRASRAAAYATWGLVGLRRRVVLVAHEPDPPPAGRLEEAVRRWAWRRVDEVVVHSEWERRRWTERYGTPRRQRHSVVEHGDFFATGVSATRAEARERLGLPPGRVLLLMIGFLSAENPDKGYDRAIAAVREAGEPDLELHVVGTPIRPGPATEALVGRLREAAAATPAVVFREDYVDDESFDLWLRAADAVLTPYRTASSSGVVARARLLGTRVVTSDAGGLAEQAGPDDIVVGDDRELVAAVRRVAAEARRVSG